MTETKTYQLSAEEPTSTAVVECVADVKGVDPCDLDDRLYDRVDPAALDALFEAARADTVDVHLSFRLAGCQVTLEGTGAVTVLERGPEPAAPSARL